MQVVVSLGCDDDEPVTIDISDDSSYTPEVVSDLLRRAGEQAIWLYGQIRGLHTSAD